MEAQTTGAELMLRNMLNTYGMSIGFLKSALSWLDGEEAKVGQVIVQSMQRQMDEVRKYMEARENYEESLKPYVDFAVAMTADLEWLAVPLGAKAFRDSEGVFVETMVYVADTDVEEALGQEGGL